MAERGRAAASSTASRLILDAGAIIALSRGDHRARAFLSRAIATGADVVIPSVALAETVRGRGPRDAGVNRVVTAVDEVTPADEEIARRAGALLGAARSSETIDAIVVATADRLGGGRILTGDASDLRRIAPGARGVAVHAL